MQPSPDEAVEYPGRARSGATFELFSPAFAATHHRKGSWRLHTTVSTVAVSRSQRGWVSRERPRHRETLSGKAR